MSYHVDHGQYVEARGKGNPIRKYYDARLGADVYNCKIKYYPDGKRNITFASHPIFRPNEEKDDEQRIRGLYLEDEEESTTRNENQADIDTDHDTRTDTRDNEVFRDDVIKRNRERVFDIVYCNNWYWFLTITFDPKLVNSSNVSDVMSKLRIWLSNKVERNGLQYILVPEKFKKSDGIHCHALINDALTTVDSGRVRIGKQSYKIEDAKRFKMPFTDLDKIYNVPEWKYGFSTAIRVNENGGALSVYLTKYITKGTDKIFGRYYWSSRNIDREPYTEYYNVTYDEVELEEFAVPGTAVRVKYLQEMDFGVDCTTE